MELTRDGSVFTLDLGDGPNAFNSDALAEIFSAFDEVEKVAADGPVALVTTAQGKSWCQGLDLAWIGTQTPEASGRMVADVHRLYLRLLRLPAYTVAAVTGHAFGAGAMLAVAHDASFMKADSGWWCLPEGTIGLPFTAGMGELLKARIAQPTLHRAMVTSNRWTGPEAAAAGIVTAAVPGDELLATAQADAAAFAARPGSFLVPVREQLYPAAIAALETIATEGLVWGS